MPSAQWTMDEDEWSTDGPPPQPQAYCQQPAPHPQLLQQQVCQLSLGHPQQATLVSSAWWPVVDAAPAHHLPWTWLPAAAAAAAAAADVEDVEDPREYSYSEV